MSHILQVEAGWIASVTSSSVNEGPSGTLGHDKSPKDMASSILSHNKHKSTGSILRYLQFVINRSGKNMSSSHKAKIQHAMSIIRHKKRG
jgi:hypothetical protein